MPSTISPLNDYILIRRQKAETTSKGGIFLPGGEDLPTICFGEVLAVGPGKYRKNSSERIPPTLEPGNVVLFRGIISTITEVGTDHDGEGLLLLHEEDIEGLVVEP